MVRSSLNPRQTRRAALSTLRSCVAIFPALTCAMMRVCVSRRLRATDQKPHLAIINHRRRSCATYDPPSPQTVSDATASYTSMPSRCCAPQPTRLRSIRPPLHPTPRYCLAARRLRCMALFVLLARTHWLQQYSLALRYAPAAHRADRRFTEDSVSGVDRSNRACLDAHSTSPPIGEIAFL